MGKQKWQRGSVIIEGEVHFLATSSALGTASPAGTCRSDVRRPELPFVRARPGQPVGAAPDRSSGSCASRGLVTDGLQRPEFRPERGVKRAGRGAQAPARAGPGTFRAQLTLPRREGRAAAARPSRPCGPGGNFPARTGRPGRTFQPPPAPRRAPPASCPAPAPAGALAPPPRLCTRLSPLALCTLDSQWAEPGSGVGSLPAGTGGRRGAAASAPGQASRDSWG